MKNLFIVLIVIFSLQLISKVTIIKEDADKILFEYTQDKYEVNDSDEFIEIISNELNNSTHSGAPMIPSLTKQIILPQNGNIQIEIFLHLRIITQKMNYQFTIISRFQFHYLVIKLKELIYMMPINHSISKLF